MESSLSQRFWSKVGIRSTDECWPWLGAKRARSGAGGISIKGKYYMAPRIAYTLYYKEEFDKGELACHKCDNPICVNPYHIFKGTQHDNLRDMRRKGRARNDNARTGGNRRIANEQASTRVE